MPVTDSSKQPLRVTEKITELRRAICQQLTSSFVCGQFAQFFQFDPLFVRLNPAESPLPYRSFGWFVGIEPPFAGANQNSRLLYSAGESAEHGSGSFIFSSSYFNHTLTVRKTDKYTLKSWNICDLLNFMAFSLDLGQSYSISLKNTILMHSRTSAIRLKDADAGGLPPALPPGLH